MSLMQKAHHLNEKLKTQYYFLFISKSDDRFDYPVFRFSSSVRERIPCPDTQQTPASSRQVQKTVSRPETGVKKSNR